MGISVMLYHFILRRWRQITVKLYIYIYDVYFLSYSVYSCASKMLNGRVQKKIIIDAFFCCKIRDIKIIITQQSVEIPNSLFFLNYKYGIHVDE